MLFHKSSLKITNILEVHWYNDLPFASELIFNDESYGTLKTSDMETALFNIQWGEWG